MRWTKAARFFLKLAIICGLAVFLTLYPGTVALEWLGYQINMPIFVLMAAIFALTSTFIFFHHLWAKIWEIPEKYFRFLQKRRQVKGEKLLIDGLTAIAAHQPEEAQSCIELAKVLIPHNPLTLFVAAQSAHMSKNNVKATKYFEKMLKDSNLRFLGLRGLIIQAHEHQDWVKAEELIQEALALRPDSPWLQQEALKNQICLAREGQAALISTNSVHRFLSKPKWQRHQAILFWIQAEKVRDNQEAFHKLCLKAHESAPEIVPFAVALARSWLREQNNNKAQKVLMATYKHTSHRDLGTCWLDTLKTYEPLEHYQSLQKLTASAPHHPESEWILAQAALRANLWGQARQHLNKLLELGDSQSVCALMAQVESAEYPNHHEIIREWWQRAATSPKTEGWVCQSCAHSLEQWYATCEHCGGIDSIEWVTFEKRQTRMLLLNKAEAI